MFIFVFRYIKKMGDRRKRNKEKDPTWIIVYVSMKIRQVGLNLNVIIAQMNIRAES